MPVKAAQQSPSSWPTLLRPEHWRASSESVFDDPVTQGVRTLLKLFGIDTPQGQAMALMAPMQVGPDGGLVGAAGRVAEKAAPAVKRVIKAFHGSPHDFDRFSMEKIGTGEGAQAYGHGLYFAENPGVAQAYREALSSAKVNGVGLPEVLTNADPVKDRALFESELGKLTGELGRWRANGLDKQDWLQERVGKHQRAIEAIQQALANPSAVSRGRMYEVNIHATPDQLLDWDKPLSEQSDQVRKAVDVAREKAFGTVQPVRLRDGSYGLTRVQPDGSGVVVPGISEATPEAAREALAKETQFGTGQWVYDALSRGRTQARDPQLAAQALKEAGIPGLKYFDAGSRAAGEGSRNFVIWDDKLITVLRKYGVAMPAILKLRELARQNGGQVQRDDLNGAVGHDFF